MYVTPDSLSPQSRTWIYQANRQLTDSEVIRASEQLHSMCNSWMVHGQPLKTSFEIRYHRFIILFADESESSTSGCSIDSSVRAVKSIGEMLGIDFFNRNLVAFLHTENVVIFELSALKENFRSGILHGDSLTFNNLVSSKSELDSSWIVPARDTYMKRYLPADAVKSI